MPSCSVKWCGKNSTSSSYAKDGITFHKFPRISKIKAKWIAATNKTDWVPSKNSVMCSRHFTPDCFDHKKKQRRLFSSAVPTLLLPALVSPDDPSASGMTIQVTKAKVPKILPRPEPSHQNSQNTVQSGQIVAVLTCIQTCPSDPNLYGPSHSNVATLSPGSIEVKIEPTTITANDVPPSNAEKGDPLSLARSHSPSGISDIASSELEDAAAPPSLATLRKQLQKKEKACKEHVKKIQMLQAANKRLCEKNETLKHVLTKFKKKILVLKGRCAINR